MTYTFVASRISGNGNALFPDKLTIDDDKVTYYKGKIIGYDQSVIMRERIGSVSLSQHLLFGDIVMRAKAARRFMQRALPVPMPNRFSNCCHKCGRLSR